ncbi:MAG: hypothetical protein DRR19_25765 [Candidatus Parabeggiatoa sp. nov. 1]|nr:MAG: hypothetical protein DRR19_25765 [Gammaproteobacteria bacterium]
MFRDAIAFLAIVSLRGSIFISLRAMDFDSSMSAGNDCKEVPAYVPSWGNDGIASFVAWYRTARAQSKTKRCAVCHDNIDAWMLIL